MLKVRLTQNRSVLCRRLYPSGDNHQRVYPCVVLEQESGHQTVVELAEILDAASVVVGPDCSARGGAVNSRKAM